MNGLIVVNKETGKTSRDIVNSLNHIFNTKKIGHTGTLDPIASGVLVCVIGKYTKLVNLLTSDAKEYIAEIKLGIKTDTLDITGNVISTNTFNITETDILKVFKKFQKLTYKQYLYILQFMCRAKDYMNMRGIILQLLYQKEKFQSII